ncbi:MAG: RsmG family class I SAM-dependent methyltransferase, partial [Pseudomonadota bacterium]
VHSRVQDYAPDNGFDTVVARAFASLEAYAAVAAPLVARGGRIVAMRGRDPGRPELPPGGRWQSSVRRVSVPTLEQQRHVVVFEHDAAATD